MIIKIKGLSSQATDTKMLKGIKQSNTNSILKA